MRFSFTGLARLGSIVLLWGAFAVAGSRNADGLEIKVLVYNSTHASPPVLERGEVEAARVFRKAGVKITWLNCSNPASGLYGACDHFPAPDEFVLHIVPEGKTDTDFVFGLSFLDQNGTGKYADLFFDRVEQAHRDFGVDISRLLGAIAAHELGHLLLGSHAHSSGGIMAPRWEEDALRNLNMGSLLFTREQASRIQSRLQTEIRSRNQLRMVSLRGDK